MITTTKAHEGAQSEERDAVEQEIHSLFESNYEQLRMEGGYGLSENVIQSALQQVLCYWRKLRDLAESVTDTEVRLTLPDQKTPDGRRFTIEGIVDIVRENEDVWMYDIKTHDPEHIRKNTELYEKQLNVYAHIYKKLRGNKLDHTAIISTAFPFRLKLALEGGGQQRIDKEMAAWEPVIELDYDEAKVHATIADFAEVVDKIENRCFQTPPLSRLKEKEPGTNVPFATYACRNCDARFSCEAYREYALQSESSSKSGLRRYFEDYGDAAEHEAFITSGLDKTVEIAHDEIEEANRG